MMGNKELAERLRDAAAALDGTALRVSTSKFDTQIIADLLIDAAEALETCWPREGLLPDQQEGERLREWAEDVKQFPMRELWEAGANQIDSTKYGDLANCATATKPMTNGDRVRAMTDEELAESDELLSGLCNVLHGQGYPCEENTCRECLLKWLGSPAQEGNDE